ncbi:hypothetical protein ATK36_2000 [Amycolatopsis sulphurea]|uniref:Uncharacterized protein n=1 Tax=Amycolatopsis sulphurea TaxID=76022 RepID=A0A2A9F8W9_9PSEU|nr:hypothetical protein ATK36_2000 [Amycolatopsis sulphurea]
MRYGSGAANQHSKTAGPDNHTIGCRGRMPARRGLITGHPPRPPMAGPPVRVTVCRRA